MRVTPKTNEELNRSLLLEDGIYPFKVTKATERLSKSGNEMIELNLKICDKAGNEILIRDYLLDAMSFKIKHFCETTGLIDKYNLGEITEQDCIGKQGMAKIVIKSGNPKPDGGYYPDQNAVDDYVIELDKKGSLLTPLKQEPKFINDDIPF